MRRLVLAGAIILTGCVSQVLRSDEDLLVHLQPRILTDIESTSLDRDDLRAPASAIERYFGDSAVVEVVADAPPGRVWPLLLEAYEVGRIRLDFIDSPTLTVANPRFELTLRHLGGFPPSAYVDCGSGIGGRPFADEYSIRTRIASRLLRAGESSTRVLTRLDAVALPSGGSAGRARDCRSTQRLEQSIAWWLAVRLPGTQYFAEGEAHSAVLDAPPAGVWPPLLRAYEREGYTPEFVDSATMTVAIPRFDFVRRPGGFRLSSYLDCGTSTSGIPLAEDSQIQASVVSRLVPIGEDSTRLLTRFEAMTPPSVASGGRVGDCRSTGQLEEMLLRRTAAYVAGDPGPAPVGRTAVPMSFPISYGGRVRVTLGSNRRMIGTVVSVHNDTLVIATTQLTPVSLASVARLEVPRSRSSQGLKGVIIGGVVGGLAGWLSAASGEEHWKSQGRILGPSIGALVGGLMGGLIGSKIGGEYWEEVSLGPGRPGGAGPGIRLELRVRMPWRGPR